MKPTTTDSRKKKIVALNIISSIIILGIVLWGVAVFFHIGDSLYTDDAQVESYINPINTRIPAYIKEIRFTEHQQVKKGDTLVVLDDREYKIQLAQATSALADADAVVAVANSGEDIAGNTVNIANANIEELKARLANMETNFKRYQNLLKDDAVTQYQFDQVKTELDAMRAKYNALQAQHKNNVLSTGETGHRVTAAEANMQKAQAVLDMAKLNLSYTVITAPYDGVVGRRMIEEGQLMQAGQPLVTIVRGGEKWVTANYTESQIERLHIGQKVNIKIDAISGKMYGGKVTAISEATGSKYSSVPVDNSTGNFVKIQQRIPVRIDFDETVTPQNLEQIRTGMNVEVQLAD